MRFHVLGIPHTITTPAYSTCAFTQKVLKLCRMLVAEGHEVIHYGHSSSQVPCRTVAVTLPDDLSKSYPGHDWKTQGFPNFRNTDHCYEMFYKRAIRQIEKRKQPGDFLLCSFGDFHKPIADAHPDLMCVESGIGYPNGTFARFKVYESYAIMHAYQGNEAAHTPSNDFWYDAVIPNAFDLTDFGYQDDKKDYMLFLGRLNSGKGLHIAKQLAETTQRPLIVAGFGAEQEPSPYVTYVGAVGPVERSALLRGARAVICASTFLEPFCGVQIEAMLSGTPVISTDRGAFAEYNIHGTTGYRCKTYEQFVWAVQNISYIRPEDCRVHGVKFSLEAIAPLYTDYFKSLSDITTGKGWYEPRPDRKSLSTASFS